MKLPLTDKGSLKLVIFVFCVATVAVICFALLFQLGSGKCFIVAMWDIGWPGYCFLFVILYIMFMSIL